MDIDDDSDDQLCDETAAKILEAKATHPGMFVSAWEADEEDIDRWTEEEIQQDVGKQIIIAAQNGDEENVRLLLKQDPTLVQAFDGQNYTALHRACFENRIEIIKILLAFGADIHALTVDGFRPIHNAAFWGNTEAVDILLQNGADVNSQTDGGQTPLHFACSNYSGNPNAICRLLLEPNADILKSNSVGETVKDLALRHTPLRDLFEAVESGNFSSA